MAGRALLIGFAASGMILLAYALLSDAIRHDFTQSGERREGAFAGVTTLLDKLSAALAISLMGGFLAVIGYVPGHGGAPIPQGPGALLAIRICVAVVPAVSMLAAILAVSRYDLDPEPTAHAP